MPAGARLASGKPFRAARAVPAVGRPIGGTDPGTAGREPDPAGAGGGCSGERVPGVGKGGSAAGMG